MLALEDRNSSSREPIRGSSTIHIYTHTYIYIQLKDIMCSTIYVLANSCHRQESLSVMLADEIWRLFYTSRQLVIFNVL